LLGLIQEPVHVLRARERGRELAGVYARRRRHAGDHRPGVVRVARAEARQ
jgi:hypothetical protein